MSAREFAPLSEHIIGYPESAPQTMQDLLSTDFGFLKGLEATEDEIDVVTGFRKQLIAAFQSMERVAISSPEIALRELSNRRIKTLANRWLVLALDKDRKRRLVPKPGDPGAMEYAKYKSWEVPTPKDLAERLPLTEGGTYLVIYGHSPQILSTDDNARKVATLLHGAKVADVLFWHLVKAEPPTLYSLRKGQGDKAGKPVAFPDQNALAIARSAAAKAVTPTSSPQDPTNTGDN